MSTPFRTVWAVLTNSPDSEKEARRIAELRKSQQSARMFRLWMVCYELIVIIWSVIAVELDLVWKFVTGVYGVSSTGQLIPFIIGLFNLLRNISMIVIDFAVKVCRSMPLPQTRLQDTLITAIASGGSWRLFY